MRLLISAKENSGLVERECNATHLFPLGLRRPIALGITIYKNQCAAFEVYLKSSLTQSSYRETATIGPSMNCVCRYILSTNHLKHSI